MSSFFLSCRDKGGADPPIPGLGRGQHGRWSACIISKKSEGQLSIYISTWLTCVVVIVFLTNLAPPSFRKLMYCACFCWIQCCACSFFVSVEAKLHYHGVAGELPILLGGEAMMICSGRQPLLFGWAKANSYYLLSYGWWELGYTMGWLGNYVILLL